MELLSRLGKPLDADGLPAVSGAMFDSVPFYAGLTLEEIGGTGVRWQDRDAASSRRPPSCPTPRSRPARARARAARGHGAEPLGRPETEHAPALRFLAPTQRAELSQKDAADRGIVSGDEVEVSANGTRIRAEAALRAALPAGSVFLVEGTAEESANALVIGESVEVRKA